MEYQPRLNLVVIRSRDLDQAERFYNALGLVFTKHRHGKGPEHLACEQGGLVFEVYPADGGDPTTRTRLGFCVESVDTLAERLTSIGAQVHRSPADSPWGRRAVMRDFDGHFVELTTTNLDV